jgi:hypothetical protein
MYTSGWPKNQNKCWYKIGSPPEALSKKDVFKFLSVNNIVIAPANTGKLNSNKKAVINTDQTNKGKRFIASPLHRILKIVTIKLIAPAIEDAPAKCNAKMPASTEAPECAKTLLNGGYNVQPEPTPDSTKADNINKHNAGGNNQREILFILGKAMSGAPIIIGTNQLPKAPIITGITIKNIIISA